MSLRGERIQLGRGLHFRVFKAPINFVKIGPTKLEILLLALDAGWFTEVTLAAAAITKICPVCEQEYKALVSELKRGWAQTCSRSCSMKHQQNQRKEQNENKLLPCSGVTDKQVIEAIATEPNFRAAAKRLGVDENNLRRISAQHGLTSNHQKPRQKCVSPEDIKNLASEGYTRRDTAYLLGISPAYLKDLIRQWRLADTFIVSKGRAAAVAKNGYAWAAGQQNYNRAYTPAIGE